MSDMFGQYKSQSTRILETINSSKYPDTNEDLEANVQRLNVFVDYVAQYLGVMQKGVDQANMDMFQRTRDLLSNIVILLGGGTITDIDFGDLQYFLPALGALFGFDSDTPFPINLFNAAEKFLLGYVVPLDSFGFVIIEIILSWLEAFGVSEVFLEEVSNLLEELNDLGQSIFGIIIDLFDLLDIFGVGTGGFGPFADIWHSITKLLGGFSLESLGELFDPVFEALAPWIKVIALFVDWLDQIVDAFSGGLADLTGILNLSKLFTPFLDLVGEIFDPVAGIIEWIVNALLPTGLIADLVDGFLDIFKIPGLDASKIISGEFAIDFIAGLGTALFNLLPKNIFSIFTAGGTGLATDPDMSKIELWVPDAVTTYDVTTEQAFSGTTSLKATLLQTGMSVSVPFTRTAEGTINRIITEADERFTIEARVRSHASNASTKACALQMICEDSKGVLAPTSITGTSAVPTSGAWTKLTLKGTVPAGYDRVYFRGFSVASGGVINDSYYWDKPLIREQTWIGRILEFLFGTDSLIGQLLASVIPGLDGSKIVSGSISQAFITGLTTVLSDLGAGIQGIKDKVTGYVNSTESDFDNWLVSLITGEYVPISALTTRTPNLFNNANFTSGTFLTGTTGWSLDGANARGILGSALKTTGGGGTRTINLPSIRAAERQSVKGKIWLKWAGVTGVGAIARMYLTVKDEAGTTVSTLIDSQTMTGTSTGWTELSGTMPILDQEPDADRVYITLEVANATAGNIFFGGEVEMRKPLANGTIPGGLIDGLGEALDAIGEFATQIGSTILEILTGIPFVGWAFTGLRDAFNDFFDDTQVTAGVASDAKDIGEEAIDKIEVTYSNNLIIDPRLLKGYRWTVGSGFSAEVDIAGNRWRGVSATGTQIHYLTGMGVVGNAPATNGSDRYNLKYQMFRPNSNTDFGNFGVVIRSVDAAGAFTYHQTTATYGAQSNWAKNNWHNISLDFQVPSTAVALQAYVQIDGGVPNGQYLLIRNPTLREETTAQAAVTAAATADGKAVTAQTAAATADGKAVTAQTAAATADGKAVTADGKAVTADGKAVTAQGTANTAVTNAATAQTTANTATTKANDIITNIASTILDRPSTSAADTAIAADKLKRDIEANTIAITAMQSADSGEKASGKVVVVDFSSYPDGAMPSIFTVTYSGAGTSQLVIDGGKCRWNKAQNGSRNALVRYNVEPTATNFQILRGVMASPPEDPTSSGTPYFYACARMNAAGTDYIWARARSMGSFFQYKGDIGCTIGGVEYVWESNIDLTWSLDMTFVAGVGLDDRQHQVFSGGKLVKTYTEYSGQPGGLSPMDASHRYWGSLAMLVHDPAGVPNSGGVVAACSVADNELPAFTGATAMMYRTSATTVNFVGGMNDLPSNFFGFVGRETRDADADPSTGTITIKKKGNWAVRGRVNIGVGLTSDTNLHIKANGTVVSSGPGFYQPRVDHGIEVIDFLQLEAGDVLNLAPSKSGTTITSLNGGGDGKTIFSATRFPDPI